jgi:hypothetical protein
MITGLTNPVNLAPKYAAKKLISGKSVYIPEELQAHLNPGPESALVIYQHNPLSGNLLSR